MNDTTIRQDDLDSLAVQHTDGDIGIGLITQCEDACTLSLSPAANPWAQDAHSAEVKNWRRLAKRKRAAETEVYENHLTWTQIQTGCMLI